MQFFLAFYLPPFSIICFFDFFRYFACKLSTSVDSIFNTYPQLHFYSLLFFSSLFYKSRQIIILQINNKFISFSPFICAKKRKTLVFSPLYSVFLLILHLFVSILFHFYYNYVFYFALCYLFFSCFCNISCGQLPV